MNNQSDKTDLMRWMEGHPQEYGGMAMGMGETDLLETFIMGQAALLGLRSFTLMVLLLFLSKTNR